MKINEKLFQSYENMKLVHYDEMTETFPHTVPFDELGEREVAGVLKANRHINGRLMQTYTEEENHVAVIAATRLGKTTSYVVPSIISYAKQKRKRSMIISDPKGELYANTAAYLRANGYLVKLINFRDYKHSECWNPLTPIFRKYQEAYDTDKEVTAVKVDGMVKSCFNGKIYNTHAELEKQLEIVRDMRMEEVGNDIDGIAQMFLVTYNTRDPYWEDCARELFKAFVWGMLEDSHARDADKRITENTFSFSTIVRLLAALGDGESGSGGYFERRDKNSRAYTLAKNSILENAPNTRKCILSSLNSRISVFKNCAMRLITSCNSFEMSDLVGDKPIAIFIDYRDELTLHYQIISLFIQNAYTYLIEYANSRPDGKMPIPFYFILDEFGNFPKITDFQSVISACGGRNIFFILILQSYAQLNNVYGNDVAEIIRDNLNVHIFLGSNNPSTLEAFSRECGKYTLVSPLSALNGGGGEIENYIVETIPRVTMSMLSHFARGECIVTEANCGYVMYSKLERYYECAEFGNLVLSDEKEYKCPVNVFDRKYVFIPKVSSARYPFDY